MMLTLKMRLQKAIATVRSHCVMSSMIVIALAFGFCVAVWLPPYCSAPLPPEHSQNGITENEPERVGGDQTDANVKVDYLSALHDEIDAPRHFQESTQEPGNWRKTFVCDIKITDALIAMFTIGLAIFTAGLWLSTNKLWTGAEETAQRQLRAYISVSAMPLSAPSTAYGIIESGVHVVAMGQTPAYNVRLTFQLCCFFTEPPDNVELGYPSGSSYPRKFWSSIAPKYDESATLGLSISPQMLQPVRDGKEMIHLIGTIRYCDIFSKEWTYYFCFRFLADGSPSQDGVQRYNKPA